MPKTRAYGSVTVCYVGIFTPSAINPLTRAEAYDRSAWKEKNILVIPRAEEKD